MENKINKKHIAERADGNGTIQGTLSYENDIPFIKENKKYARKVKVMKQSIKVLN